MFYLFILIYVSLLGPMPLCSSHLEQSSKSLLIILPFKIILAVSFHLIRHPFRILIGSCIKFIYKYGEIWYLLILSLPILKLGLPCFLIQSFSLFSIKFYTILDKYIVYLLLDLIRNLLSLCYYVIFKGILIGYFRCKKATMNSHLLILYPPNQILCSKSLVVESLGCSRWTLTLFVSNNSFIFFFLVFTPDFFC